MNLKLFIVMGVSWLLEILATVSDSEVTWSIVSDIFNLLQGVLVFSIFVLKRSVLVAFQKKLGKLRQCRLLLSLAFLLHSFVRFIRIHGGRLMRFY
jgi:hypothetical protein